MDIESRIRELRELLDDETLERELEGIRKKHQALAHRERKPGRVRLCALRIRELQARGVPVGLNHIVDAARAQGLSPASTYRLMRLIHPLGIDIRATDVVKALEQRKSGIY